MGQDNWGRHEFGCFITGIAEHQALVARSLFFEQAFSFGHALRDIGRLRMDLDLDMTTVGVKSDAVLDVTDLSNRLTNNSLDIDLRTRRNFACNETVIGGHQSLTSHSRILIS